LELLVLARNILFGIRFLSLPGIGQGSRTNRSVYFEYGNWSPFVRSSEDHQYIIEGFEIDSNENFILAGRAATLACFTKMEIRYIENPLRILYQERWHIVAIRSIFLKLDLRAYILSRS